MSYRYLSLEVADLTPSMPQKLLSVDPAPDSLRSYRGADSEGYETDGSAPVFSHTFVHHNVPHQRLASVKIGRHRQHHSRGLLLLFI